MNKALSIFFVLLLFPLFTFGDELSLGYSLTPHLFESKDINHIGDKRTTTNPSISLKIEDFSVLYFKDSINSDAYGIVRHFFAKKNGIFEYGLGMGVYAIDRENWNRLRFKQFWIIAGQKGIVPIIAPELNISIFEKDNLKLSCHSFFNGIYLSSGLFLRFKF